MSKRSLEFSSQVIDAVLRDGVQNDNALKIEGTNTVDDTESIEAKKNALQKYEDEWAQLFEENNIENLRKQAQNGCLRASRFRSICWRVFLEVLVGHTSEWVIQLRNTRCHYQKLKAQMTSDPHKSTHIEDNPLSQNGHSVWHQHFCDEELRAVIRQDVVRTFPGIDFFRKLPIQELMVDILFVYARVHPLMCYRQGMHEILAPLLFVLHCDQQAMLHTKEQGSIDPVIEEVLNPQKLEEDGYILFSKIMCGIEFCYKIKDLEPTSTGYFPSNVTLPSNNSSNNQENEVILRLNWIREHLLKPSDPELCEHLHALDIPLPIFGIRWLRLLFGREFPLQDLLVLWDAIFAEGKDFQFLNFIVVAMLIAIRSKLINSDYTNCLTSLMRYPSIVDIAYVIDYALHLKNPEIYSTPPMSPNTLSSNTIKNNPSENKFKYEINKTLKMKKKLMENKTNYLPNGPISIPTALPKEPESTIVEGFTLQDPQVLKVELNHAHSVMTLCHLKLTQYHKILERTMSPKCHESEAVLDGILELCKLLRTRHYGHSYHDVEHALEAGELKATPPMQQPVVQAVQHSDKNMKSEMKAQRPDAIAGIIKKEEVLNVFSQIVGINGSKIDGAPMADPLNKLKDIHVDDIMSPNSLTEAVRVLNINQQLPTKKEKLK